MPESVFTQTMSALLAGGACCLAAGLEAEAVLAPGVLAAGVLAEAALAAVADVVLAADAGAPEVGAEVCLDSEDFLAAVELA
jgi:hypothetical protein